MSDKSKKRGRSAGKNVGIYRELEELAVCMIGAALLICVSTYLRFSEFQD